MDLLDLIKEIELDYRIDRHVPLNQASMVALLVKAREEIRSLQQEIIELKQKEAKDNWTDIEGLVRWIVENVNEHDVPADEGNEDALVYNLVQLARHGRPYRAYDYQPEQDSEIEALSKKYGRPYD